jgi:hypothetical protein
MSSFEKIYQTDPFRETKIEIEKHKSIEIPDHEITNIHKKTTHTAIKFEKPKLEKEMKEVNDEKNASEIIERKPKKVNSKPKQPAMASL